MQAFVNGKIVSDSEATVSILDRGFLYGDGVFETLRIYEQVPFRLSQHWQRLEQGAAFAKIILPYSLNEIQAILEKLISENQIKEAIARMTLSRGIGLRGYSTKGAEKPTFAITLHPLPSPSGNFPPQWNVITSSVRVPAGDLLSQHKTCNKLANILARAEAEGQEAEEALLLNTRGEVTEGAASNLFWIERGTVCTPPIAAGVLPGVTRAAIVEICQAQGLKFNERSIVPEELNQMEGVFLTLSTMEVVEVLMLDIHTLSRSPMVGQIARAYREMVEVEVQSPRSKVQSNKGSGS